MERISLVGSQNLTCFGSEVVTSYALNLRGHHDKLLDSLLVEGTYEKLYSYHHLINGFAVHMSSLQAEFLRKAPGVKHVERDIKAVQDGVDILNLSVGPNSPPTATRTTFLNPFDAALLSAVKAGVFVAQAAGNGGPFPKTLVSFSPWITTVAAGVDDRRYKNHLTLGNGKLISGLGVSTYNTWEYHSA